MTIDDVYKKHGEPIEIGWWAGEYLYYDERIYFTNDQEISKISLRYRDKIFGIKIGSNINEIRSALGKADIDGYIDYEE